MLYMKENSPEDYPGTMRYYLIGGWDYDRRETKWRRPDGQDGFHRP